MSSSITGIPTSRVSDMFVRERLLAQVQFDLQDMSRLQMQLSTGQRFDVPSEDPIAAMRVMSLQSLLERKTQIQTNLSTNETFLGATDSALSNISGLLGDARSTALGVLGTTATDVQRQAAAEQVDQILRQMMDTGNQKFRGRYLFAGSQTSAQSFDYTDQGLVQYLGNERHVSSYADIDQLFDTNVQGNEVFGAMSEAVRGTADLTPLLTADTRLSDLRQGAGINLGSIAISDGSGSPAMIVDLSKAKTIGDVVTALEANPPQGNTLDVQISGTGLTIQLGSGNLSINEIGGGGGTTAGELGILRKVGSATPIVGSPLKPVLRPTTALSDLLGGGLDQSGLRIVNAGKTFDVSLSDAQTVEDLLNKINGSGAGVCAEINQERNGLNIRSRVSGCDFSIGEYGGQTATQLGLRTFTDSTMLQDLNTGRGVDDPGGTDFTITLSDGTSVDVDLAGATDVGAVRTAINAVGGGKVTAELAANGNGITLVGAQGLSFTVTCAAGHKTAVDLGLVAQGHTESSSVLDPVTNLQVVAGTDVRPLEADGVFTALLRLRGALRSNDLAEAQRAIGLLDNSVTQMSFTRAELAARQQGLDATQTRLDSEATEIKKVISDDYDADIAEVISNLTARQVAYEASLRTAGQLLQVSLLNYL